MNKLEKQVLTLNTRIIALETTIKCAESTLENIKEALLLESNDIVVRKLNNLKTITEDVIKNALTKRNTSVRLKAWSYYFDENHITYLGNGLNIIGFNSVSERIEKFKDSEVVYEGLLESLSEKQAVSCVSRMTNYQIDFIYMDYNKADPVIGFKTAKESIKSACNMPYIVIYKTN